MVYYRKYRPQTIGELDSASVRETLHAVLSKKDVPHAFLFTGPKGLGKTSTARIIAKVVNCEHPKNGEPDNTCDQCLSITAGTNMDVLEIDGASNRGIDEIRDLRERVRLAPSNAKKKVYIIDEVHMLTTEAFNALLKTIEEPPAHVMFMFCTTEPQKVPATILSRCFHIAFARATEEEIVHSLERIVAGEKISIEPEALKKIAHLAEGGFRDAAKLLEEVVAFSGDGKITASFVEEKLHISGLLGHVASLLSALSEKDAKKGLAVVAQLLEQGADIKLFTAEVLETLHQMLLTQVGVAEKAQTDSPEFSLEEIQILLGLFSESVLQMKSSVIVQLPLELVVIGWCAIREEEKVEKTPRVIQSASGKPTIDSLLRKEQNLKVHSILYPKAKEEKPKPTVEVDQSELNSNSNTPEMLMENIIYKVKPINASVAGVLRGCIINSMNDEEIVFETAYKFHKERLEEEKTYAIIEKVIREVTGKSLKVTVHLKK